MSRVLTRRSYRLVSEGAIVKPSVAVADLLNGELESRTVKVTLVVPLVNGVPRMACEAGSKVRPNGMATGCQIKGGNPPAAANVVTGYGTFTRPSGSDVLVIMRGGSIVMDRDFCTVSAGLEESWSVNVWVVVAAVVGVPLIDPLVWLNVRLGGRAGDTDHV